MSLDGGNITAVISGLTAVAVATVSLLGSRAAQRSSEQQKNAQAKATADSAAERKQRDEAHARALVEQQAYLRARQTYERIVGDLESQMERQQKTLERLQNQLDSVLDRLTREQDVSNSLRTEISRLHNQIDALQRENDRIREVLNRGGRAAGAAEDEVRRAVTSTDPASPPGP